MPIGFTDRSGLQPETQADRLKPITLTLDIVDERRVKAILVADPADRRVTAWLPRSQIKIDHPLLGRARITMPTWLAVEHGLAGLAARDQKTLF